MNTNNYKKLLALYSKNVIASKTDLKGIITYVSDAFCEISGFTRDELVGASHNIVRHPDMSSDLFEELWKTIKSNQTFTGEIKNRRKDGSYYWVEVTIEPILDDSGEKIGYSAIRQDITQKKETELLNYEYQKLLGDFSKYVIASKTDLLGNITYVTDAFCKISGFKREELIGRNHNIVRHPDMPNEVFEKLWKTIKSEKVFFGEFKNRMKNEDYYWVEVAVSPDYDNEGSLIGYSAIRHNITQKKIIEELMIIDTLTKVKNRLYYDRAIQEKIDMFQRYKSEFSLVLIDIDNFKTINDTFGHDAGDSILIELSRVIENSIRQTDEFCRIGGEEFAIIFPHKEDDDLLSFAQKLVAIVENHNFDIVNQVTISVGVAHCEKEDDKSTLFKKADKALYNSKDNGRNQVTLWTK